jgi:thiamine biosynthesis lipoprotein
MGTRFEFVLEGAEEPLLRDAAEEMAREVELWHRRLSRFETDSELVGLCRRACTEPTRVDAELFGLLGACERYRVLTAGAFDIRTQPAEAHLDLPHQTLALRGVGDPSRCPLDLGGVAKGFALEQCAAIARELGITHAFLHAGTSSVLILGQPKAQLRVRLDRGSAILTPLPGVRLSVSAPRERGHIHDPRTGHPAARTATAFVIGPDGVEAEAWSTALVVLGERPSTCPEHLTTLVELADGSVEISGLSRDTVSLQNTEVAHA